MTVRSAALVLIGFQNDYFADDGILRGAIEAPDTVPKVLATTLNLIRKTTETPLIIISTPILFTPTYEELVDPIGILKMIKDTGAFRQGTSGGKTIPAIQQFGSRIVEIPGKRGLNAFSNTNLDGYLKEHGVKEIALGGVVTSLCIDSTARSAFEQGYTPVILSDCTAGRTPYEQKFYCEQIFPLYAQVMDHLTWLRHLGVN